MPNSIFLGDNLPILSDLEDESVNLIYIKPPPATLDTFNQSLEFLLPRLKEAERCLTPDGSLYFHSNYEVIHYYKVKLLDEVFQSRDQFLNEIIWVFESKEKTEKRWAPKHDTILVYAKDPAQCIFNNEAIDRITYMAPGLVGKEKAKRGKLPTDTWWYTNIENKGKEETSSSTLPLKILQRIITAASNPGDVVLDLFARDGKVGEACLVLEFKRDFILIDKSRVALKKMAKRFKDIKSIEWINFDPTSDQ